MIHGQSEYIGAVILVSLVLVITYVASDWLNTIYSVAKNAVQDVEHAKELLDVALDKNVVTVFNKGSRISVLDTLYVKLRNGTLIIEDAEYVVKPGGRVDVKMDYRDVENVCIETVYSNVFCGYNINSSSDSLPQYAGFWSYERVSPRYYGSIGSREAVYNGDAAYVVYRVKRVVAPDTHFYIYAVPENNVALAMFEEDVLHRLNIYINLRPGDVDQEGYISITCGSGCIVDSAKLIDGDDTTAGITSTNSTWLNICIDMGSTVKGWFYINANALGLSAGGFATIAISNSSCVEVGGGNITIFHTPASVGINNAWIVNARSIRFYSQGMRWEIYSLEFYPYNVTRTVLSFPSTKYSKPISTTISIFALSNTYLQVLELTMLPKINSD